MRMHPNQRLISLRACQFPAALAATLLLGVLLTGCGETDTLQGYVEGDYVDVAAPLAGRLETLSVRRGETVRTGDPLFQLEDAYERAAVAEAEQNALSAENSLADKGKGQRPSEIAAIQAQLREASSSLEYARTDYERKKRLFAERTISTQELDLARTEYETARQTQNRIRAELNTARLGGRSDEIAAAQAQFDGARAQLEQARWNLDQKRQQAPVSGLVFDTFYDRGEWVAAGKPVVSLLPSENIKVVFFVPETQAGTLRPGMRAEISFDGAVAPVPVTISYVSPEAEYTPPVIYSSENRAKLVFLVEARPEPGRETELRPGQPVDVRLAPFTPDAAGPETGQ
ncbi:MAG: HlyD family secretion protein [Desulfovibrio sp.]